MRPAIILIAVFLVMAWIVPAGAAVATRPVVIVFGSVQGEGADKALAESSTRALCSYMRESGRVEATVFDRESPTVLRAIMDKDLTADQVASYSSQQQRIVVAKALLYEYAAGAEVSVKNGMVQVQLWMAKSARGKKDRWEAAGQAATGGGSGDRNLDNAMQSATSAAVISITRQAFLGLPAVAENAPTTGAETTAIGADLIVPPAPPSAGDYAAQADASLKAGNLAVAIQQYMQAVNADPSNASLRIKLADAYARKGLYDQASTELDHAATMGAGEDLIDAGRKQIADLRAGQGSPKVDTVKSSPEPLRFDTVKTGAEPPKDNTAHGIDPKAALARIREGDRLWRVSKLDEAADAYTEATKLNPSEWRAYERLALVDASMSLFAESRKTLAQLAAVQPDPSPRIVSSRYELFSKVFDQWFNALFKQYDRDAADYERKTISRESYYSSTKGLGARLESMAKFLDALTVPNEKKPANLHRSLACGLVSQAAASLQDYLEANNADSKANAETFVAEAKKELEAVKKLEPKQVVVEKQPAPAPAPPTTASPDANAAPPQPDAASQDANAAPPEPGAASQDANAALPQPTTEPDPNAPPPDGPDPNAPAPPPPIYGPDGAPVPPDYMQW